MKKQIPFSSLSFFAALTIAPYAHALVNATSFDNLHGQAAPLVYAHACDEGDTLTVAAVGDFLFHAPLQIQAGKTAQGYEALWHKALPLFNAADIRYGNLEGPVAPGVLPNGTRTADPGVYDGRVYSEFPRFNYPDLVARALADTHISIVSTANNHAMDRTAVGVDETITSLRAAGVKFVGTREQGETSRWFEITESKGFSVAWVACTFSTNGISDRNKQVLGCFSDTPLILNLVHTLSNTPGIDAVIVTPHWGVEYQAKPNEGQVKLGKQLMDAGALAVIGTHPHVLEPWLKYVSADGKEHFLIYSTGNFVSAQTSVPMTTSVLVYLTLGRNASHGTFIRGVGYVPLRRDHDSHGYSLRPLSGPDDAAPAQSWSIWNTFYGKANRLYSGDSLERAFCTLSAATK